MAAPEKPAEKQRRPSVFSDPTPAINSLFGEILDWMLAPLLLVWPISIAATHHIADGIANQAYDHVLAEHVVRIAHDMKITSEGVHVALPPAATAATGDDDIDRQYFPYMADDDVDRVGGHRSGIGINGVGDIVPAENLVRP